jgi:hypothetical protein
MATPLEQLAKYLKALGLEAECREHPRKQELQRSLGLLDSKDPAIVKIAESLRGLIDLSFQQQTVTKGEYGEISVVIAATIKESFEIFCLKGDLFNGIRRYKTVTDCGRTIYSLLTSGTFDEKIPRVWDAFTDFLEVNPDGSTQKVIDSPFKKGESF